MVLQGEMIATVLFGFVVGCGVSQVDDAMDNDKSDMGKPKPITDAGADAATGPTGLGTKCDVAKANSDCPTSAPLCTELGNGSYCSPRCISNGTGFGTSGGGFYMSVPAPNDTVCKSAFDQAIGEPACGLVTSWIPMDDPIVADKAYSGLEWRCVVKCGTGNACPATMVPSQISGGCYCLPK
jgi:hypothetical protein